MVGLIELLAERVAADPEATLFLEPHGEDYERVNRRDFALKVDAVTAALHEHGVGAGDCVGVWLPNWTDAVAWQFAAASLGAQVIGVNTRYNVHEVAHVLAKARPKVLALPHDFQRLDLVGRARAALADHPETTVPAVVPIAGPGKPAPTDLTSYDLGAGAWLVRDLPKAVNAAPTSPSRTLDPDRLVVAFTTSGSTGMPKLAAHSEAGVLHHAVHNADRMDLRADDVIIAALPFSGVFGYNTVMAAIAAGAATLLHPAFDERVLVHAMAEHRVTHYVGADDMLVRIHAAWREHPVDLSAWRRIFMADFIGRTPELAQWAADEFGTVAAGVYGSSETFALLAFWPPETELPLRWGGGGMPTSDRIEVRVADPDQGTISAVGEEGELQFRGPNVVNAYLGDAGEAAASFTDDGWFRSGDAGRLLADGSFIYTCRIGDVLRLRGFLVAPGEIEARLLEHPAVENAKVVGVPDATGESRAIGFVTLQPADASVTGEELVAWCKESLARFKVPELVQVIDEMPTVAGTNGAKIKAASLRELASALYKT